jgi:integrase
LKGRHSSQCRVRRQRQEQQQALIDVAWKDHDLVFPNAIGEPMRGNHILQRNFSPILTRAGLPQMRFHDLRHTAATLLLIQGVHPKIVSEMLGHSTVSMTLDTYSHVLPDMQRDATAAFVIAYLARSSRCWWTPRQ